MTYFTFPIISTLTKYFVIFHGYAGIRLYVLILVILIGGCMDGFGIALFLPLLSYNEISQPDGIFSDIVRGIIEALGIETSVPAILLLIIVSFGLKGIMMLSQQVLSVRIEANLVRDFRLKMAQKYSVMDYNYYINSNIGYLNNLITTEVSRAVGGFAVYCRILVSIVYVLVYISGAMLLNSEMTITILICTAALLYLSKTVHRRSKEYSVALSEKNAQVQSILIQAIYNFKYLKATATFNKLFDQLKVYVSGVARCYLRIGILSSLTQSMIEPFSALFVGGLIFYHVVVGGEPLSEIVVLIVFCYRAFTRIFGFQSEWQKFNASLGGVDTVEKAKEELDSNVEPDGKTEARESETDIVFRDVDYSYNGKQVLFGINMVIRKNTSVGIVGESGAGKTTLFDLMTGLLTPQGGEITIGEIRYNDIKKNKLRTLLGYVTQEPVIFNDTIANNISFWECPGDQDGCMEKVHSSAQLAYSSDFIKAAGGYDTVIGDKGVKLSGGQRQRIAIAREIFKDPEIMIFDEATSSLDSESERYIQKSVQRMKGKKTLVIIAHRVSTIRYCDYIYVLKQGRIVEEGAFEELYVQKGSVFRKMCQAQKI